MVDKKMVLPVVEPPITTFPGYANTLAILFNYEKSLDWVYSHYLQIYVSDSDERTKDFIPCSTFFLDFDIRKIGTLLHDGSILRHDWCPYLYIHEMPSELLKALGFSYETAFKHSIDLHNYLYMYLDVSKIKEYGRSEEMLHCVFIYGYDDSERVFYFADFPNSPSGKYNFSKCTYHEIEAAMQNSHNVNPPFGNTIAMIKYAEDIRSFTFDFDYLRETVKSYVSPDKDTEIKFNKYLTAFISAGWKMKSYIGSNVYDYLIRIITFDPMIGRDNIDARPFHGMYDHKVMMLKRFEYLYNKGYIDEEKFKISRVYEKVRDDCLKVRNMIIKYNITKRKSILDKIPQLLDNTKNLDVELLSDIFEI